MGDGPAQKRGRVSFMHKDPEALGKAAANGAALAEGVFSPAIW